MEEFLRCANDEGADKDTTDGSFWPTFLPEQKPAMGKDVITFDEISEPNIGKISLPTHEDIHVTYEQNGGTKQRDFRNKDKLLKFLYSLLLPLEQGKVHTVTIGKRTYVVIAHKSHYLKKDTICAAGQFGKWIKDLPDYDKVRAAILEKERVRLEAERLKKEEADRKKRDAEEAKKREKKERDMAKLQQIMAEYNLTVAGEHVLPEEETRKIVVT